MLVGKEIERLDTERPDFIKRHCSKSKREKDTIVGIEHFRVDHLSVLKQNGDIGSSGIVFEKDVYKLYNKWHEPVQNGEAFSEKMLEEIGQIMANQLIRLEGATYHSFIDSFKYSLEKTFEQCFSLPTESYETCYLWTKDKTGLFNRNSHRNGTPFFK